MKLYRVFFSPTGGTKRAADLVCGPWECDSEDIDLSDSKKDFSLCGFQEEDICLVAVPSFGGRVPEPAVNRISKMKGGNARAVLLTVYGNRAYEDTLLELSDTLRTAGFRCAAAIAAVAEHSIMHQFAAGRPDAQDEKELTEFAVKIKNYLEENTNNGEVKVPGNTPYREFGGVPFRPETGKKCNQCGTCALQCPVDAIPKEKPASTDSRKCISCMRCIAVCPQNARSLNKVMLFAAAQKMKKACSERKPNELFPCL